MTNQTKRPPLREHDLSYGDGSGIVFTGALGDHLLCFGGTKSLVILTAKQDMLVTDLGAADLLLLREAVRVRGAEGPTAWRRAVEEEAAEVERRAWAVVDEWEASLC